MSIQSKPIMEVSGTIATLFVAIFSAVIAYIDSSQAVLRAVSRAVPIMSRQER